MLFSRALVGVAIGICVMACPVRDLLAQNSGTSASYHKLRLILTDGMIQAMKKAPMGIAYVYEPEHAGLVESVFIQYQVNGTPSDFNYEDKVKEQDLGKPLVLYLDDKQIQGLIDSPNGLVADVAADEINEITRVVLRYLNTPTQSDKGLIDSGTTGNAFGSGSGNQASASPADLPVRTPADSLTRGIGIPGSAINNFNLETDPNTAASRTGQANTGRDAWDFSTGNSNGALGAGNNGAALANPDRSFVPSTRINQFDSTPQQNPSAGITNRSTSNFTSGNGSSGNFTSGNLTQGNGTTGSATRDNFWATQQNNPGTQSLPGQSPVIPSRFASNVVAPPLANDFRNTTQYGNNDALWLQKFEEVTQAMDALNDQNRQLRTQLALQSRSLSPTDHDVTQTSNNSGAASVKPAGASGISSVELEDLKQKNRELGRTVNFVFFLLFCAIGLCAYLSWIARGFYARYAELADELRETLTGTP